MTHRPVVTLAALKLECNHLFVLKLLQDLANYGNT